MRYLTRFCVPGSDGRHAYGIDHILKISLTVVALMVIGAGMALAETPGRRGGVTLGVRDSRYVTAGYLMPGNHVGVELEHGVQAVNIRRQQIGGRVWWHGARKFAAGEAGVSAGGFVSTTWSGAYTMAGAMVGARYSPHCRIGAEASFVPYHDSEYRWVMAWSVGLRGEVTRNISVLCRYTTIPDYRLSERRIHAGVDFHVGALWVTPVVSVPVGSSPAQSVRLLVSCGYTISL